MKREDYEKAQEFHRWIEARTEEVLCKIPSGIENCYSYNEFCFYEIDYEDNVVICEYEEMWCGGGIYKVYLPIDILLDDTSFTQWVDRKLQEIEEAKLAALQKAKDAEYVQKQKRKETYLQLKKEFEKGSE